MSKEFNIGEGQVEIWPKLVQTRLPTMGITFNDVNVVPGDSTSEDALIGNLESRSEPDLSVQLGPYTLDNPIVVSPMDTISDIEMAVGVAKKGGIACLYRHQKEEELIKKCLYLERNGVPFIATIGLKDALNKARTLKERGKVRMLLLDIANGGLQNVPLAAEAIQRELKLDVIAGNIAQRRHSEGYKKHGIRYLRVGIGPGQVCTTRIKTGVGIPQISAIFDTAIPGVHVIADGGIDQSGKVVKALVAGAKSVMIGSLFAGTDEAPGEIVEIEGNPFKRLRGQASGSYMKDHGTEINGHHAEEGVDVLIPYKGSIDPIIDDITGGLRSAMLYVGARNLDELYEKAQFVGVTQSGYVEGTPTIYQQGNVYTYQGKQ